MTYPTMNPEVKQKWIGALRSGNYEKVIGNLRVDNQFCALGVLCDLHSKETGNQWAGSFYMGSCSRPSLEVRGWANLQYSLTILMNMNDGYEWSFKKIADWIEGNL